MTQVSKRFDDLGADGAPARLGIMGGTFDPIHLGHLRIAEEVREELTLDAVLFIPTGNPVFKRDQHVTDAHVRLEQVRRAVEGNPYFDVSPIEVDREGDTFTVDTLRALRAHYPENVELYFIVGSDSAATIGKWRGSAEIAQLTHLAVAVGRPGSMGVDELRATILSAAPFTLHFVKTSILEISSSGIRDRIAQGKTIRYFVPDWFRSQGVMSLLLQQSTGERQAIDVLSDEFFEERKAELQTRVKPKRFKHSLGVSQACEQLARRFGLDVRKARLAGLLHDWDKGYDDEGARARVRELGMEEAVDPWVVENMPMVLHGETAAVALGRAFPDIPADVLQAISRHTTAAEDMEPLDMVLYIADAIEPSRQFGRIDELRAAVATHSLEDLYFETYEYWVFLLFERGKPLHPDTIRIWNSYTMKHPRKSGKKKKEKREK